MTNMSNVVTRTVTYIIDLCSCIYHSALNWKNSAMENVVITVAISVPQQNHLEFTQHLCDFPMAIPSGLFWDLNYFFSCTALAFMEMRVQLFQIFLCYIMASKCIGIGFCDDRLSRLDFGCKGFFRPNRNRLILSTIFQGRSFCITISPQL